jgi:uncharacterized protein (DUF1684 family)
MPSATVPTWLDLYDWRRRAAEIFRDRDAALAKGEEPGLALTTFREAKDALFRHHRQSPLSTDSRSAFAGLRYFAYDSRLRMEGTLTTIESRESIDAPASGPHAMPLQRAATVDFRLAGEPVRLTLFWIDVYGGGLFLPFRDATCPAESYGAGRYLFDSVKGSGFDLDVAAAADPGGYAGGTIVLDFNYAYNPSCAYDPRWACPLAPRENWIALPIRAGERKFHDD